MTAKELIELLSKYPPDTPILREYDMSYTEVELTARELHKDDYHYSVYHYANSTPLVQVLIIHNVKEYLEPIQDMDKPQHLIGNATEIVALEMEQVLPKIKEIFERDNQFFQKLK